METIQHESYTEQKFKVRERLYGDVPDEEIYLYENMGNEQGDYTAGEDYVLVLEKTQPILYDHDRYMLSTAALSPGDIPAVMAASANKTEPTETAEKPVYVGTVNILELVSEGKTHNGNVYRCTVESLTQGDHLNTYEDGTILLVLLKNTVEPGSRYTIAFSPAHDESSLIYIQSTPESVSPVGEPLLKMLSKAQVE